MFQVSPLALVPPLLLATDGSPSAQVAQRLLYPLGQMLQPIVPETDVPTIIVVTVQPRHSSRSVLPNRKPQATGTGTQTATRLLELPESLKTELRSDFPQNLRVDFQTRSGRPATEILNCARAIRAGLIAVGHRGTGGMRELLLGSVSAVIARYAPCSVLIAREDASQPLSFNHVLLLVDGSPASKRAIALVRQLAAVGVRRVTLLCPQPSVNAGYLFGPFVAPTPSWQLSQSLQAAQKEHSQQLLQEAKAAMQSYSPSKEAVLPDLEIQTLAQTSEPGPLICEIAAAHQVNLIVLGSDFRQRSLRTPLQGLRKPRSGESDSASRPPLRNTRLSATEDYTIHHAPCPVLLHRVASQT